jgi:hypothetical protein
VIRNYGCSFLSLVLAGLQQIIASVQAPKDALVSPSHAQGAPTRHVFACATSATGACSAIAVWAGFTSAPSQFELLLPEDSADIELGGMDWAVRTAEPRAAFVVLSASDFSLHLKTGL